MYIATDENLATSTNRYTLFSPVDQFMIAADNFGALDGYILLSDIWFNGITTGDKLIVFYTEYQEPFE